MGALQVQHRLCQRSQQLHWVCFRCTVHRELHRRVRSHNFEIRLMTCPLVFCREKLIKDMADRMAADGYKDVGYEYVIIDDCWLDHNRSAAGQLQPDPWRFPSGIKSLADYVSDATEHTVLLVLLFVSSLHHPLCTTHNCFIPGSQQRPEVWHLRRLWHQDLWWLPWHGVLHGNGCQHVCVLGS